MFLPLQSSRGESNFTDDKLVVATDINNQGGAQQELYWYMNSGHEQTESFRTGFFGP